ncbi:phage tail protein [Arthrobacter sp. 35W]|uniref:phage tail protein n=1 Tax=Arthrobacter sp. 35W TaxID=1132441 RepID=UPI000429B538|nr:tail fiber protein [Arthrobacter sp. 35W]
MSAAEPYVGDIIMVGFYFAPRGWLLCDGSLLPISQYEVLFVLLGTTYGGDGVNTFAVPDLRGRVAVHQGRSPASGTTYVLGQTGGSESVTVTNSTMASHQHWMPSAGSQMSSSPMGLVPAQGGSFGPVDGTVLAPSAVSGGNQPHDNIQPFLSINFVICAEGIFPSQS